jgi:hypothetical protein
VGSNGLRNDGRVHAGCERRSASGVSRVKSGIHGMDCDRSVELRSTPGTKLKDWRSEKLEKRRQNLSCIRRVFTYFCRAYLEASVAQPGRASRCQRECRGFESLRSLHFFVPLPTLTEPLGEGHSRRAERLSPTLFCYPIPWLQSETGMGSRGVRRQLVCCRPISKWKDGSAPRCLITSRKHRTRSM